MMKHFQLFNDAPTFPGGHAIPFLLPASCFLLPASCSLLPAPCSRLPAPDAQASYHAFAAPGADRKHQNRCCVRGTVKRGRSTTPVSLNVGTVLIFFLIAVKKKLPGQAFG
ncbi:hypothetical protein [Erwinia psidii]|uniref:hypothetical protein n=1 Tax=Erwinia psidii TaxID=69224 RepID=UPI00226B7C23|nr:hypothetical protein [Erwinia psidii]